MECVWHCLEKIVSLIVFKIIIRVALFFLIKYIEYKVYYFLISQ